jgi:stage II sporulation protein M
MKNNTLSFKFNLVIAIAIYIIGLIFSLLLNMKIGELTFSNYLGPWYTIFFHNFKIHFIIMVGGIFFSIPSMIILFMNGLTGGFYIAQSLVLDQFHMLMKAIFFHGFFEIPATLLSATISLQISFFLYKRIIAQQKIPLKSLRLPWKFTGVVLLTLIAAIIEGI